MASNPDLSAPSTSSSIYEAPCEEGNAAAFKKPVEDFSPGDNAPGCLDAVRAIVKCKSPCKKDYNKLSDSTSSEDIDPKPVPMTERIAPKRKSEVVTSQPRKNEHLSKLNPKKKKKVKFGESSISGDAGGHVNIEFDDSASDDEEDEADKVFNKFMF